MHLKNLHLVSFKNYPTAAFEFDKAVNCFVGPNGIGKTNLLDAIYYLCMTKSAFQPNDQLNIRHGDTLFSVTGNFEKDSQNLFIACGAKKGGKKVFKKNKKEYTRISDHIGLFPCVLIAPDDTALVREGSETRRKFFDNTLSQTDHAYLEALIRYNQALKQRNHLLKFFAETHQLDREQLAPYDTQMSALAKPIIEKRHAFAEAFTQYFLEDYQQLSNSREIPGLAYAPDVAPATFADTLQQSLRDDLAAQRTTRGIHKDDYLFSNDRYPVKKFASQGQLKTYVISLKLAQYRMIRDISGIPPLLLLDDIFDKLDDTRIANLLATLFTKGFGQIFISDARPERSEQLFQQIDKKPKIFYLEPTDQAGNPTM